MTCKYCGATLPEEATFCPACNQSQIEKKSVSVPKPRKKWLPVLCLVLLLVIGASAALLLRPEPPTAQSQTLDAIRANKEGVGSATYDVGYDHYVVSLSSDGSGLANQNISIRSYGGNNAQLSCRLIVSKNGEDGNQAFLDRLDAVTVEVIDVVGEPMTVTQPERMEDFPEAALVSMVTTNGACESCTLQWTCQMADGALVIIRQNLTTEVIERFRYFADEYPMHTDEELDALMAQILEETPENALVQLFLPAVTYEKPHTFPDRCYQILGAIEGEGITTFLDTVTFSSEKPEYVDIQNAVLQGGGTGIAVQSNVTTGLMFCTLQGWETAVDISGGGSLYMEDCVISANQVGLRWNSEELYEFRGDYKRNVFENNGIAIQLLQLPGTTGLSFRTCTFAGNDTDIQNDTSCPINLEGAELK